MHTSDKLDAPIRVHFTARDKANLARQAQSYGLTLSGYLRLLALFGRQRITPPPRCRRLTAYRATGNPERLVDCVALPMLEFVEGTHPTAHWAPGDDGEHTREVT